MQEYNGYTIDNIETNQTYIEQVARCRENALKDKANGVTNPPKIIDDQMLEFYGTNKGNNDLYGIWFSNCYRAGIIVDRKVSPSSEHHFQKAKFDIYRCEPTSTWCIDHGVTFETQVDINKQYQHHLDTLSPVEAARSGRVRTYPIRNDWEQIKHEKMWEALVAKFTQHEDFKAKLLETGDRVLIERAPNDDYWGINNDGKGKNMLGVMLMAVRQMLRQNI